MRWILAALIGALVAGILVQARAPLPRAVRPKAAAPSADPATRGRDVYLGYGCAMCHGPEGKGGFANPNAETEGKVPGVIYVAEGYTKKELRQRILDGTPVIGRADPNGPRPPFRMPGLRDQMSEMDLDALVEYLFGLYPKSAADAWR